MSPNNGKEKRIGKIRCAWFCCGANFASLVVTFLSPNQPDPWLAWLCRCFLGIGIIACVILGNDGERDYKQEMKNG